MEKRNEQKQRKHGKTEIVREKKKKKNQEASKTEFRMKWNRKYKPDLIKNEQQNGENYEIWKAILEGTD